MGESPCVVIDDLTVHYDSHDVLSNINLRIERNEFLAVTGPNGGGKTTLLKSILRLVKPIKGQVTYYDSKGVVTSRLRIGYLPQKNTIDAKYPLTVKEVVESGLHDFGNSRESADRVDLWLERIGLTDKKDASLGTLSGGQVQRALLGRAMVGDPELIVMDEPLSYVDKTFEPKIYDIMLNVKGNSTVIVVSHEMTMISALATRHIFVDHGITECHARSHSVNYCDCCQGGVG